MKITIQYVLGLVATLVMFGAPQLTYASDVTNGNYLIANSYVRTNDVESFAATVNYKPRIRGLHDSQGRIFKIENEIGESLTVMFDDGGLPHKILASNGLVFKIDQHKKKTSFSKGFATPAPMYQTNGKASPTKQTDFSLIEGGDCFDSGFCSEQDFMQQCLSVPGCIGVLDSVASAFRNIGGSFWEGINNLANLSAVMAGFMGTLGLSSELLTGGTLAAALEAAGFGIGLGFGVAVIAIGGYIIGTVIYDQFGEIIWRRF